MDRKFVRVETHVTRYVPSSYTQPLPESQNTAATMMKNDRDDSHGTSVPRTHYAFPPPSDKGRGDEHDIPNSSSHSPLPRIPYPVPSLHGKRDITPSPPSSTSTATTCVNPTPHSHLHPNPSTHHSVAATPPFSIRQTFSAYPNIDLFEESLRRNRNNPNSQYSAQEVADKIPQNGSRGVPLQDPAILLERRLSQRRRRHQKLEFAKTAFVYVYGQGVEDMPVRHESTKFHDDDGDPKNAGPWRRNRFTRLRNELDAMHYLQACDLEACKMMVRWDSVKKDYKWTTWEKAKDLSGREDKLREKAMAKRAELLREEAVVGEG